MAKLIVWFITTTFEIIALLFLVAGAVLGWIYGVDQNQEIAIKFLLAILGVGVGFLAAALVLGIPLLVLRINQNLEEINTQIRAINQKMISKEENKEPVLSTLPNTN